MRIDGNRLFIMKYNPRARTVELGGNVAPGETVFNLQVVDSYGDKLSYDGVEIIASPITTNGAGSYTGKISFKGTYSAIFNMFKNQDFVFVKQADIDDPDWIIDDAVWCLSHKVVGELSVDEGESSPILIYSATIEQSDDGVLYNINEDEPVEKMSFINKYTKTVTTPSGSEDATSGDSDNGNNNGKDNGSDSGNGKVSKTDVKSSVKTGDTTNLSLWIALMLLSGVGIIGVTLYTRRKRTNG